QRRPLGQGQADLPGPAFHVLGRAVLVHPPELAEDHLLGPADGGRGQVGRFPGWGRHQVGAADGGKAAARSPEPQLRLEAVARPAHVEVPALRVADGHLLRWARLGEVVEAEEGGEGLRGAALIPARPLHRLRGELPVGKEGLGIAHQQGDAVLPVARRQGRGWRLRLTHRWIPLQVERARWRENGRSYYVRGQRWICAQWVGQGTGPVGKKARGARTSPPSLSGKVVGRGGRGMWEATAWLLRGARIHQGTQWADEAVLAAVGGRIAYVGDLRKLPRRLEGAGV